MRTEASRKAQMSATVYLEMRGYIIIEQHYHTPSGEIPIIADDHGSVCFIAIFINNQTESTTDYLSHKNAVLSQVKRAAETWVIETKYSGTIRHCSIELLAPNYSVIGFSDM